MYNVLLVDDEAMVRIGVKTCVNWGRLGIHTVYEASNGLEALRIMDTHKIDIVITDIKMSVMDGFSMLEEMVKKKEFPIIIVMSCYNDYENMRLAMAYGVKDFLFKPKMYPRDIEEAVLKAQGEMENHLETGYQDAWEIVESVSGKNYLEQFSRLYELYQDHHMEIEECVRYFVDFLNKMMKIDDATNPSLHIFSTVMFQSLYEIRKCKDKRSLLSIMAGISNRSSKEQNQEVNEELFKAIQFIDLHLTDADLNQEMAAEYVGLSVSYFCRLFKNKLGMSYSSYIIKKRIELAETLYLTTNMKISDIARAVGYTNDRYFARLYKEHKGDSMKHVLKKEN